MDITVFKRREIKYLVDAEQRAALEKAFEGRVIPDEHGESTVCNVYCDTKDSRLIRTSLQKPAYKEKFRIRSYGAVSENGKVFMELKKKYAGIVYKRRISLAQNEASDFISGRSGLPNDGQIEREIDYFVKFYGGLVPAMYLCYDRMAYFCKDDPGLRITLDENIRWRTEDVTLTSDPDGRQLLASGQSLMEIKCGDAMPLWLVGLLSENRIRPVSFSKYGTAYTVMLSEQLAASREERAEAVSPALSGAVRRRTSMTERSVYCA